MARCLAHLEALCAGRVSRDVGYEMSLDIAGHLAALPGEVKLKNRLEHHKAPSFAARVSGEAGYKLEYDRKSGSSSRGYICCNCSTVSIIQSASLA